MYNPWCWIWIKRQIWLISFENIHIMDFNNLCDATYASWKIDRKCEKLKDNQLHETKSDNFINIWKLDAIISDGVYEHKLTFFSVMNGALMSVIV